MLSVIAVCAVAQDWFEVRRSHLDIRSTLTLDFAASLLSAAEGDEDTAIREITLAEQRVFWMDYDELKTTMEKCQNDFDHLKRD